MAQKLTLTRLIGFTILYPYSFRHYFVTIVLRASGNLKVAQALARHSSISTTSLYAHLADDELDKTFWEAFEKN